MKKRTRSILEEIDSIVDTRDRANVIESRANHVIAGAINIIQMLRETYDETTAGELERRLINSIRSQDAAKFARGIRKARQ